MADTQETKKQEDSTLVATTQDVQVRSNKTEKKLNNNINNELNKQLETCKQEVNDWKEKFMRAHADLDNFQKRVAKEQLMWVDTAQAKILTELLNIVDDFDRAFVNQDQQIKKDLSATLRKDQSERLAEDEGFVIIYKSLQKMLEKFGVKKMDNYQMFDPNFHEALVQVDSDEYKSGQIVEVLQDGYLFKNHVLRPAKVSVAK